MVVAPGVRAAGLHVARIFSEWSRRKNHSLLFHHGKKSATFAIVLVQRIHRSRGGLLRVSNGYTINEENRAATVRELSGGLPRHRPVAYLSSW